MNQLLVFYARHLGTTPPEYLRSVKTVSSLTSGLYKVSLLWLSNKQSLIFDWPISVSLPFDCLKSFSNASLCLCKVIWIALFLNSAV